MEQVRNWHSEYYLNQLTDWFDDLKGSHQIRVLQAAWLEHANLMEAWVWAIERSNNTLIRNSVIALTVIIAIRGQYSEFIGAFEKAIRLARQYDEMALLSFLLSAQYYTMINTKRGSADIYRIHCKEAFKIIQIIPESRLKAYTQILLSHGENPISLPEQLKMCQQSADFLQTIGDDWGAAIATLVYGDLQNFGMKNYSSSENAYQYSLKAFTKIGNEWGRGMCMYGLAHIALANKEFKKAGQHLQECCTIYEKIGDLYRLIDARLSFVYALMSIGDQQNAKLQLEINLKFLEKLGWKDALSKHRALLEQISAK